MDESTVSAIAGVGLLVASAIQIVTLRAEGRRHEAELVATLHRSWERLAGAWGYCILLGRLPGDYYNMVTIEEQDEFGEAAARYHRTGERNHIRRYDTAMKEALQFISNCGSHILTGRLSIEAAYSVFGSEFLRQSRPLRVIVDQSYSPNYGSDAEKLVLRHEQDWCFYHPGVRRRVLILVDLLWAEAARTQDLAPQDLMTAAEAKRNHGTGGTNRVRLSTECRNVGVAAYRRWYLVRFMRHAEYRVRPWNRGLNETVLRRDDAAWVRKLLRDP